MRWQVDFVESGLLGPDVWLAAVGSRTRRNDRSHVLLLPDWRGVLGLVAKTVAIGILALIVFGVLEFWPRRLPPWLPRWLLQLAGLAVAIPIFMFVFYLVITPPGHPPFWEVRGRRSGFAELSIGGLLVASMIALYAVVRQREADVRRQALSFDLERSEYERKALDARLQLLQAQVEPHFLFNTLANIRSLVEAGAPQAISVLDSLIDYLQAAVPRLHEPATTLGQELQLVRAYLELMRMRIPDRLSFELRVDDTAEKLLCPPMTLLALVENAVRHGIDPSEEGGRIEIDVRALRESMQRARHRHRSRTANGGTWARDGPRDPARAPGSRIRWPGGASGRVDSAARRQRADRFPCEGCRVMTAATDRPDRR